MFCRCPVICFDFVFGWSPSAWDIRFKSEKLTFRAQRFAKEGQAAIMPVEKIEMNRLLRMLDNAK